MREVKSGSQFRKDLKRYNFVLLFFCLKQISEAFTLQQRCVLTNKAELCFYTVKPHFAFLFNLSVSCQHYIAGQITNIKISFNTTIFAITFGS